MAWHLAKSLDTLRAQINALAPRRSKASDGTIGDQAHAASKSEHNPDAAGRVRALDITHDPAGGVDGRRLAEALLAARDPRILYVISRGQIASGAGGREPWAWRKYGGKNPHAHHTHISVVDGAAADDPKPWAITAAAIAPLTPVQPSAPARPLLVLGNKGERVEELQRLLNTAGAKLTVDADFGDRTMKAVAAFQRKRKLVADGKVGPQTWRALAL